MIYTTLFIEYLKNNRNYSDWTINWYRHYLRYFNQYLKAATNYKITIQDCEKITKLHIQNFIWNQISKGKNPRTVNVYLSAIKWYLAFCESLWKEVINTNTIKRVKESPLEINALLEDESTTLLEYFKNQIKENPWNEAITTRNYCICYLLIYTGLRLSELHNLKISQISENMLIRWKGKKNRIISLFEEDLEVINNYLKYRTDNSDWLFISFSRQNSLWHLSRTTIQKIIKKWWKETWIGRVFPHKLRHTFATNLLRRNAKLTHIQRLLWHSSLATTQIYLTVLDSELRDTQKLLHVI